MLDELANPVTWYHVAGYAYAILVPLVPLYRVAFLLWMMIAVDSGVPRDRAMPLHRKDLPFWVGVVERILYVAAWVEGAPEFIGIWLALKVAGGWQGWAKDYEFCWTENGREAKVVVPGRHIFNTFLLSSALSLLPAVAGAVMIETLLDGQWPRAIWIGVVVTLLLLAIWSWAEFVAWRQRKRAA